MTIKKLWEENTTRNWPWDGYSVPASSQDLEAFAKAVRSAAVLAKSQEAPTREPILFDPPFRVGQTVYVSKDKVNAQKGEVHAVRAVFSANTTQVAYLLKGKHLYEYTAQHLFATPEEAFQPDIEPDAPSTRNAVEDDDSDDEDGDDNEDRDELH